MLLRDGIATIFENKDVSGPGEKPRFVRKERARSYYARLQFSTRADDPTGRRKELRVDARIRIRQQTDISEDDTVVMDDFSAAEKSEKTYRIVRVFHGADEDNAMPISDLSLEEVSRS